jgi:hypothetical protein
MRGDLSTVVALVRLRAEAGLLRRLNAGHGFADPRIPGQVYVRDGQARARIGRSKIEPKDTHKRQAAEVEQAIAAAAAAAAATRTPIDLLAERVALAPTERAVLVAAVAYEIDADVRDLCHALAPRRSPALYADVITELAPELDRPLATHVALHPSGALRAGGLLAVEGDGAAASVRATRRLLDWLAGDDRLADTLASVIRMFAAGADHGTWIPPAVRSRAQQLAVLLRLPRAVHEPAPMVVLQGTRGSGRRAVAAEIASALDRPLMAIPVDAVAELERQARAGGLVRTALVEARLRGAIPYLSSVEALVGDGRDIDRSAIAAVAAFPDVVIVATGGKGGVSMPFSRPFHLIRMPTAGVDEREAAWRTALARLDGARLPPDAAPELAGRYVIGPGAIAEVSAEAAVFARAAGSPVDGAALEEAVGRRLTIHLGAYGTLVARKARFEEMVLPEEVVEALRDMITMVKKRSQILERWGYQRHLGISRGVSALFSGEPGTGKTMAASVIASELGLELMRIDLSQVVSKWVGETEKNLGRIFDEAQDANAMLLFDEADSLFAKRTDVKTAQDRYANLEVNYILQRMESFDGVSVLTSNFEGSIDQALQRRLNFRVRFPEPEIEEREELWKKLLPPETGVHERIPFRRLAERFEMTGGYIKNAIVRAAVIAAREGRQMTADDLWAGAHVEYAEMGKVLSSLTRT